MLYLYLFHAFHFFHTIFLLVALDELKSSSEILIQILCTLPEVSVNQLLMIAVVMRTKARRNKGNYGH